MATGERLREERKRLKMTQADFAKVGGIGVSSLKLYEGNEGDPGAQFLAAIGGAGADVQYIVVGARSNTALAADEQILLESYRSLDSLNKRQALARMLTESGPAAVSRKLDEIVTDQAKKKITVNAIGNGAQAAGKKIVIKGENGQ